LCARLRNHPVWVLELDASMLPDQRENIPQGLKPTFFELFAARLKSCPFKVPSFPQPAREGMRHLPVKACPFKAGTAWHME